LRNSANKQTNKLTDDDENINSLAQVKTGQQKRKITQNNALVFSAHLCNAFLRKVTHKSSKY